MTVRSTLKDMFRVTLDAVSSVMAALPHAPRARILNYHEVLQGSGRCPNPYNQVSAGRLAEHLDLLVDGGYELVAMSELANRLHGGRGGIERLLGLTFDDGLAEHHDIVLPILKERGLVATFYVVSGRLGETAAMGRPAARHLDTGQVRALHDAGMEIGSHSRTHRVLAQLSATEIEEEVAGSREDLARITGSAPGSFAYPYGSRVTWNAGTVSALKRAGYTSGVSTVIGSNDSSTPLFELRRIPVYGTDTRRRILARAGGAYDWTGSVQELWLGAFPHHSTRRGPG